MIKFKHMSNDIIEILERENEEVTKIRLIESDTVLETGDKIKDTEAGKVREIQKFNVEADLWATNSLYYHFQTGHNEYYEKADLLNVLDIELQEGKVKVL